MSTQSARLTKRELRILRIRTAAARMAVRFHRPAMEGQQQAMKVHQQASARLASDSHLKAKLAIGRARAFNLETATQQAERQATQRTSSTRARTALELEGWARRTSSGRLIGLTAANLIVDSAGPTKRPVRDGQALVAGQLANHPHAADILAILAQDIDGPDSSEHQTYDPALLTEMAEQYQQADTWEELPEPLQQALGEVADAAAVGFIPARHKGAPRADGSTPGVDHWFRTAIYNVQGLAAWNAPIRRDASAAPVGTRFDPDAFKRHVERCARREARRGIEWCFADSRTGSNRVLSRQSAFRKLAESQQAVPVPLADKAKAKLAAIVERQQKREATRAKRLQRLLGKRQ